MVYVAAQMAKNAAPAAAPTLAGATVVSDIVLDTVMPLSRAEPPSPMGARLSNFG